MGPLSDEPAFIQHQDPVSLFHGSDALCYDDFGGILKAGAETLPYPGLSGSIHGAGAVIQYQDFWPLKQSPGNTESLLLAPPIR